MCAKQLRRVSARLMEEDELDDVKSRGNFYPQNTIPLFLDAKPQKFLRHFLAYHLPLSHAKYWTVPILNSFHFSFKLFIIIIITKSYPVYIKTIKNKKLKKKQMS